MTVSTSQVLIKKEAIEKGTVDIKSLMVSEAATKTSPSVDIRGAKRIELLYTRANHTSGTSVITVEVTLDDVIWIAYNKLIDNVTNTNAQGKTRVASKSLGSNTSAILAMDLENDAFYKMRVVSTIATDGDGTVVALIER